MTDQAPPHTDYPNGTDEHPVRKVFGYARVSTEDQDMGMQVDALKKYGCDKIFKEKVSAVAKNREQFNAMLRSLREGDVIAVWKLDRLGRKLIDIADLAERMNKKGVQLISLTQKIDTTSPMGKAFFHLMAIFAEMERDLISERTKAGMARRREQGVKFGNPTKIVGEKKLAMLDDIWELKLTNKQIARKHGYKSIATIANYFPGERRIAHQALRQGDDIHKGMWDIRRKEIQEEQGITDHA